MSDEIMIRPPVNRLMRTLDRSLFKQTIPLSAARVFQDKEISVCRKALTQSKDALEQPRIPMVQVDPVEAGRKCLLLRPQVKHDDSSTWSPTLRELQSKGTVGVIPFDLVLDYDYWTYPEIIHSFLEEEADAEVPVSYTTVGHVAHLNLREKFLPYKQLIAEVIRDKANNIKTVINKVDDVGEENEYRTFRYEVLAGEDDLNVEVREEDCIFRFDYAKVYWNSRLHTEHQRLVSTYFKEGDAVCDVMAGVGPFAVPAGKKKVFVWANDLNPDSYASMTDAVKRNKVGDFVRPFNENGHTFIRTATAELLRTTHSVPIYPKTTSRTKATGRPQPIKTFHQPRTFGHYVMNLPATALTFLPNFIGLYASMPSDALADLPSDPRLLFHPHTDTKLPMVHAYCFSTKSDDNVAEGIKICEEISRQLQYEITPSTPEVSIYDVRDVAPNKRMFCASFRLPEEVAFRKV